MTIHLCRVAMHQCSFHFWGPPSSPRPVCGECTTAAPAQPFRRKEAERLEHLFAMRLLKKITEGAAKHKFKKKGKGRGKGRGRGKGKGRGRGKGTPPQV